MADEKEYNSSGSSVKIRFLYVGPRETTSSPRSMEKINTFRSYFFSVTFIRRQPFRSCQFSQRTEGNLISFNWHHHFRDLNVPFDCQRVSATRSESGVLSVRQPIFIRMFPTPSGMTRSSSVQTLDQCQIDACAVALEESICGRVTFYVSIIPIIVAVYAMSARRGFDVSEVVSSHR